MKLNDLRQSPEVFTSQHTTFQNSPVVYLRLYMHERQGWQSIGESFLFLRGKCSKNFQSCMHVRCEFFFNHHSHWDTHPWLINGDYARLSQSKSISLHAFSKSSTWGISAYIKLHKVELGQTSTCKSLSPEAIFGLHSFGETEGRLKGALKRRHLSYSYTSPNLLIQGCEPLAQGGIAGNERALVAFTEARVRQDEIRATGRYQRHLRQQGSDNHTPVVLFSCGGWLTAVTVRKHPGCIPPTSWYFLLTLLDSFSLGLTQPRPFSAAVLPHRSPGHGSSPPCSRRASGSTSKSLNNSAAAKQLHSSRPPFPHPPDHLSRSGTSG